MKKVFIAIVCAASLAFIASAMGGEKASTAAQKKCPISGKPVDGSKYVDIDGFRVLVAGDSEAEKAKQEPAKTFQALEKNKDAALPVVWVCPVMRNPVTLQNKFVSQNGKRIYYCCPPCKAKIEGNFAKAAAIMKQLAEQKG